MAVHHVKLASTKEMDKPEKLMDSSSAEQAAPDWKLIYGYLCASQLLNAQAFESKATHRQCVSLRLQPAGNLYHLAL